MELEVGKVYPVEVTKILTSGCIVKFGDSEETFIHISQIAEEYVSDVNDYVSVRDRFYALCVDHKDRIQLSLKHLNLRANKFTNKTHQNKPYQNKNFKQTDRKQTQHDNRSENNEHNDTKKFSFDDKLKKYMKQSSENINQLKMRANRNSKK